MCRTVLLIDDDLFFPAKLESLLSTNGIFLQTRDRLDMDSILADLPDVVLVNFGHSTDERAQMVKQLKSHPQTRLIPVIGFVGHKEVELQRIARDAGADKVVANSTIVEHPIEVIERASSVR